MFYERFLKKDSLRIESSTADVDTNEERLKAQTIIEVDSIQKNYVVLRVKTKHPDGHVEDLGFKSLERGVDTLTVTHHLVAQVIER
jgi:hypothetical protein